MSPTRLPPLAQFVVAAASLVLGAAPAQGPAWGSPDYRPAARAGGVLTYQEASGRPLLFGGRAGSNTLDDTWEQDRHAWIRRTPAVSPPSRWLHAMAADPRRGVVVLFGGEGATSWLADTWEWNGENWRQVTTATTPPARAQHAMAYHGGTNPQVLLFGGLGPTGYQGQTWGFDGTDWQLRASSGPSPRIASAMAFPESAGRTFLVGGRDAATGATLADVWIWNGTNWGTAAVTGNGPTGIAFHGLTWDRGRQRLALVGGMTGFAGSDVMYLGDVTPTSIRWTALPNPGAGTGVVDPPSRIRAGTCYDEAHARLVWFGGQLLDNGGNYGAVVNTVHDRTATSGWVLRPVAQRPVGVIEAGLAYDASLGRTLLYGGGTQFAGISARTWSYDGATWQDHGNSAIGARMRHGLVHWRGFTTILFGGETGSSNQHNDTLGWTGTDWVPLIVGNSPPPTSFVRMVYDSVRQRVVMHGGYVTRQGVYGQVSTETWELRSLGFGAFTWDLRTTIGTPPPLHQPAMAYDERRQRVVLFGGDYSWENASNEHWEYEGVAGRWTRVFPPQLPPPRLLHAMSYDVARGVVLVHGGARRFFGGGFMSYDDLWEYDGATWTQRTPSTTTPGNKNSHNLAYDVARARLVAFGSGFATETWEFQAPVARQAVGEPGGGMQMRCLRAPVAGQSMSFEFPSPSALAWLALMPMPVPVATHSIAAPLSCASQAFFFGINPPLATLIGSPASFSMHLPGWLAGYGLCLQGVAYDVAGNCFRATDPLSVTVQMP
ncbi:MAG: hypothetical protein JNK49_03870 [Planctomycetes bacterium]|nr:hypothetical protein [Planctomycetota bacterium]